MIKTLRFKSTLKQGVIMGLSFCLYTILMWLTKLDTTYLRLGQYFDMVIIILPILIIFWAIKKENNFYAVTFIERITIAIYVGLVSFLLYDPFLYIYHHYINPEWFNSVLSLKEEELKTSNVPHDEIMITLQKLKDSGIAQSGLFRLSALIPSVIIVPTLIAMFSIIFIRGQGKNEATKKKWPS